MTWRLTWLPIACLLACAAFARADPTQQQYDDALKQLQQAQDRKNQLADENAKLTEATTRLTARVAELEQSLEASQANERTYYLRMHYAAWRSFMDRYPLLLDRFQSYLKISNSPASDPETASAQWSAPPIEWFDANWPFNAGEARTATP